MREYEKKIEELRSLRPLNKKNFTIVYMFGNQSWEGGRIIPMFTQVFDAKAKQSLLHINPGIKSILMTFFVLLKNEYI